MTDTADYKACYVLIGGVALWLVLQNRTFEAGWREVVHWELQGLQPIAYQGPELLAEHPGGRV